MIALEHVDRIEAGAERVWDCVRWENLERLGKGLFKKVIYEERRPIVGARRRIELTEGGVIEERLEGIDADGRWLAYRMLDTGPVPIADYSGEVRVSACGPGAAYIRFSSRCTPVEIPEADWVALYRRMQGTNVAAIRTALGL